MHQSIRENLEDRLKDPAAELPAAFNRHLGECGECANELRTIEAQSQMLRTLRSPQEIEPRPGFYARVMERIELQPASIWSVFLERKFGLRLAVASAALIALLGTYLVTSEPSEPESASTPVIVSTDIPQQQQQRDAVLVDLASYHQ
jgi:predicted anti-sigma-YlaC factor YlaD